jgi:hypothetical protein
MQHINHRANPVDITQEKNQMFGQIAATFSKKMVKKQMPDIHLVSLCF